MRNGQGLRFGETYHALADELLQVFGGNGFSEDYPAAQMYRDSRITRIYEGTSEICRLSIAKTMLKKVARGELESGSTARQEATIADSQRVPFFFTVKPSCFTARQIVARLADVPRATCRSARVRSGCSRINAASVCSWDASTGCRP